MKTDVLNTRYAIALHEVRAELEPLASESGHEILSPKSQYLDLFREPASGWLVLTETVSLLLAARGRDRAEIAELRAQVQALTPPVKSNKHVV